MNYFTKEHEMFRESLRDFLNKEVKENINKWEKKDFINASIAFSDEYLILNDDKSKLYFNWLADFREAFMEETQEFRVNNVLAEYQADDDLSREITITAGLDYEFQPLENSLFSVNLDGLYSSQQTYGAQAKLYYKSIF